MWGKDTLKEVLIDGHSTSITRNAFLFLDALRQHQERRIAVGKKGLPRSYPSYIPCPVGEARPSGHLEWIWMDSICINQSDPNERNHQVRLMQKIYGLADHVLFHIGESATEAQEALNGSTRENNRNLWERWSRIGWPKQILIKVVETITCSKYWNRLWIVQELVLGRQVSFVTDDCMVPLPELEESPSRFGTMSDISNARSRWHSNAQTGGSPRGSRLASLLWDYRKHQCKVLVDRVYGLLGICCEDIPIDYSLSPRELSLSILVQLIPKEHNHLNGSTRISSLIEALEHALGCALTQEDYMALSLRLKSQHEHACSSAGEGSGLWWYCDDDRLLAERLKFQFSWNMDYDSTQEGGRIRTQGASSLGFQVAMKYRLRDGSSRWMRS